MATTGKAGQPGPGERAGSSPDGAPARAAGATPVAEPRPPEPPPGSFVLTEPWRYRLKLKLLGPPLTTERLSEEKLSKVLALGVLSPDMISSSAYGTEEMLNQLVPVIGVAAFSLLLPITFAILLVLFFVTLSYREVVMVYTKAGGSYVVSRDNFGPRVAQIAATALIIDYILTVCVQSAAGTDALVSAIDVNGHLVLNHVGYVVGVTVGIVLLLTWGNLRGIREAGKTFALPTYLFVLGVGGLVVLGLVRAGLGQLHAHPINLPGVSVGHATSGLFFGASLLVVLRAFANGGSSLTGLEAISNGIATIKEPRGPNARRVLVVMSAILGFLVLGVSLLAKITHAVPYDLGNPTVLSQEASYVFGSSAAGRAAFYYVQAVSMLILWTGANTSFNGFPNLASFVAEDAYLPRQLTRRGHRLVFSNGIVILAAASTVLLVVTRASVNALVALYAIGVFVGFTMAGAGMVKHHVTHRETGWRYKIVINGFAAVLSFLIVGILAVVKFTQGAWLVVVLFPILFTVLIRLHRQYEEEKAELEENAPHAAEAPILRRHVVLVLVERLDLATARALQYARTLQPDELRAVHFVLDTAVASELEAQWTRLGLSRFPLDLIECPDRRLTRAAMELVAEVAEDGRTEVSVLLPRRVFEGLWRRVLHDRTADRIAGYVSQLPNATATIVPFPLGKRRKDLGSWRRHDVLESEGDLAEAGLSPPAGGGAPPQDAGAAGRVGPPGEAAKPDGVGHGRIRSGAGGAGRHGDGPPGGHLARPDGGRSSAAAAEGASARLASLPGTIPIARLRWRQRAKVAGRVRSVRVQPRAGVPSVECTLADPTGQLLLVFQGRRRYPGIEPGAIVTAEGMVGDRNHRTAMINPVVEIVRPGEASSGSAQDDAAAGQQE
ncbi:MAG TPA: amino acid permease [Acidimicrobiales bacterium]|nr:amino acid permease [Acidimicrobiales bacterium]